MTTLERVKFLRNHLAANMGIAYDWIRMGVVNGVPCLILVKDSGGEIVHGVDPVGMCACVECHMMRSGLRDDSGKIWDDVCIALDGMSALQVLRETSTQVQALQHFDRCIAKLEEHVVPTTQVAIKMYDEEKLHALVAQG